MIETETEYTPVSVPVSSPVDTPSGEDEDNAGGENGEVMHPDETEDGAGATVNGEYADDGPMYSGDHADLSSLFNAMKQALPQELQARDVTEGAQQLVNSLNAKRKFDTRLIVEFRAAMNSQVQAAVGLLEQQLFQTYESQKCLLEGKLQELFACLDRISATEAELVNFRESLSVLYREMNSSD